MIPQITNKNLHLLLPSKIRQTLKVYLEDRDEDAIKALTDFYSSETYRQLEQEETKLWHYGPVALCQEYIECN